MPLGAVERVKALLDVNLLEREGGGAILAAQTAFYEELIDFFHSLGRRDVVKAAAVQQRMIELVIQANEQRIEQVDPEKEVASIYPSTPLGTVSPSNCGDSPTSSVPSPESTPSPSV